MYTYTTNIEGRWYAFGYFPEKKEICSIGSDCPRVRNGKGRWFAMATREKILDIVSPSKSQANAINKARRAGEYKGVFTINK